MEKDIVYTQSYLKKRIDSNIMFITNKNLDLYIFNSITMDIYELIDGKRTINEIIKNLEIIYDVNSEVLENDLINIVKELLECNLIRRYKL